MNKLFFIALFFFSLPELLGQDTSMQQRLQLSGCIKAVEIYTSDKLNSTGYANHLIHNRLNLKWKPNSSLTFSTEIRNRLFFGEQIKLIPDFANSLRNSSEYFNLQKAWMNNSQTVFHTNIERLFVEVKKTKWSFRLGRQRINWGMATTWNPNDIFNAYNFLDVDYIERPGSDAIKFQYNFNENTQLEMVSAIAANKSGIVASKLFINKWDYDFQFITGSYLGSLTLGAGWAGNIKNAGFKGEVQYYNANQQLKSQLNIVIGLDYMFKNQWYISLGSLYNSNGLNKELINGQDLNLNLSTRNLMPGMFNFISTVQKEISPLSSAGLNLVYSPGICMWILMPTLSYNLTNELDADIIYQLFYLKQANKIRGIADIGFIRLRYHF